MSHDDFSRSTTSPSPLPRWRTRPETAADRAAVYAVNAAAFETSAEAELVDALRATTRTSAGRSRRSSSPARSPA
ncbi:hypothetical protein ACISUF_24500, partial [Streptomyces sp. NPDC003090]